jgi:23S rRNA pseudouridine2605 synthase
LLFTNDGELTQKLLHPSSKVWKRYHCGLEGKPTMATLKALSEGVELQDGKTAPCRVRWRGQYLEVELREGRKRQIRRMLGSVGHPVMWLKRVAVGRVELGSLPEAACRPLSKAEVEALRG